MSEKTRYLCVVAQCTTNKMPQEERGKMFSFPREPELREEWLARLQREDMKRKTYSHLLNYAVCQLHFSHHQFRTPAKTKLNTGVVPNPVSEVDAVLENPCPSSLSAPSTSSFQPCGVSATKRPHLESYGENIVAKRPRTPETPSTRVVVDTTTPEIRLAVTTSELETPVRNQRNVRLRDLGVTRKAQLSPRKKSMYSRLQQIERTVAVLKRRRVLQQPKIVSKSPTDHIDNLQNLPKPLKMFLLSQLRNFQKHKKAHRYTFQEKSMFLSIYKHSPKCYRYLQKLLTLPCSRTLRMVSSNFNLKPGINDRVFRYLNSVSEREIELDRYCILIFDEMELSKNLELVVGKDTCHVEGFVDVGDEESGRLIADHALVFMIRGIRRRWKQPVAFYLTQNCANRHTLKKLITDVIRTIHSQTNYKVVASVSDGGSWNVGAIRLLAQVDDRHPTTLVYNVDGNKIFHLFDAPHLIKCIRNGFIGKNIIFESHKTAKWADIKQVYFQDGALPTVKMSKLTRRHVEPSHREKMRVKTAVQIFSHTTRMCLEVLSHHGVIDGKHTAEFVGFMNNLFDSLNSTFTSTAPYGSRVTNSSPHHAFWERAKDKLKSLSFIDERKRPVRRPESVMLAIHTIRNVEELWKYLNGIGFKFLVTRSLNQDPVENFFSAVRGLCGSNTRPTCSQFASAYKTCVLNNSVKSSTGTNCEDDGENFLFTYDALLSVDESEESIHSHSRPKSCHSSAIPSTSSFSQPIFLTNASMQTTISSSVPSMTDRMGDLVGSYIAGFLLKKTLAS